jgi:hypothetical protein
MRQTVFDNSKWVFFFFALFLGAGMAGMTSVGERRNVDERLQSQADSALAFCRKRKMNTDFRVLIDMKIHSGKNLFSVIRRAVIAHPLENTS